MMKLLLPLLAGAACAFHVGVPAMRAAAARPVAVMQMSDTMAMLSAELKKAQAAAKVASTNIEMLNAQEWVDELCDRMDKQEMLESRPASDIPLTKYAKYARNAELEEKNAALADKMKSVIGDGLAVNSEMYELVELHEL